MITVLRRFLAGSRFFKQAKYKDEKIRASEFRNFVKFQAKTSIYF